MSHLVTVTMHEGVWNADIVAQIAKAKGWTVETRGSEIVVTGSHSWKRFRLTQHGEQRNIACDSDYRREADEFKKAYDEAVQAENTALLEKFRRIAQRRGDRVKVTENTEEGIVLEVVSA